jgi:spermidine synthase
MACYRPGATTFFEIDPAVVRIARDPRLFTYLRDCPARIVVGDGRLSLKREPPASFDVLAIDAFNSDAIPIHLITRQALQLDFTRVSPHGVVLFHISNRYVRLEPVLASLARTLGVVCRAQRHVPTKAQQDRGYVGSKWAVLARSPADLGRIAGDPRWHACQDDGTRVWTDDYSDLLGSMTFG